MVKRWLACDWDYCPTKIIGVARYPLHLKASCIGVNWQLSLDDQSLPFLASLLAELAFNPQSSALLRRYMEGGHPI